MKNVTVKRAIERRKSTAWRTFRCLQNGNPKDGFSGLLLVKSKDTNNGADCDTNNEYAFMDQNLAVKLIVFPQILMWALSKTPLKIYRERNSLQIEEGKHVFFLRTRLSLSIKMS